MEADHHLAEQGRLLGMIGEIVEERDDVRLFKARLTCLNGIKDRSQPLCADGLPSKITDDRAEQGAPVFSASPNSVRAKR